MESFLGFLDEKTSDVLAVLDRRVSSEKEIFYLVQISPTSAVWRNSKDLTCTEEIMKFLALPRDQPKITNVTIVDEKDPIVKTPKPEMTILGVQKSSSKVYLAVRFSHEAPDSVRLCEPQHLYKDYAQEILEFYRQNRG